MPVKIVTDSTTDLTDSLLAEFGVAELIHIVPISVYFGEEEFRSGIDISTSEFYERIEKTGVIPRTSQPTPAAFIERYREVSEAGDTILSIHISSKMSGTYQSALLAAKQFSDRRIEVIDTKSASLGVGIIALRAALMAREGHPADAILERCRAWIAGLGVFFVVDTLEYLQKNGRIGRAQAFVGGLLNIKPILTVEDGVVAPAGKVRGQAKAREQALSRAREYLATREAGDTAPYIGIAHARAPEYAEEARAALSSSFPEATIIVGELGPTIGAHAGPGALGFICFRN